MKAGRIARNELGVVGIITGMRTSRVKEEYDTYVKGADGRHIRSGKATRNVEKRDCYTGISLDGQPWEGREITPLTQKELSSLG